MKKLISIILALTVVLSVCACHQSTSSTQEQGETPTQSDNQIPTTQEQGAIPTQGENLFPSTASWADKAWLKRVDASEVKSIIFVEKFDFGGASETWSFDGVDFFFKDGTVYIAVGEMLKIRGSMNGAFAELSNLQTVEGLERVDTSGVTDMSNLFKNCSALTTVSLQHLKTDSVVLAASMFEGCTALMEIDASGLNMENTIDMSRIFYDCSSLQTLKLPKTRDVETLSYAFYRIGTTSNGITEINGELNTSKCTDMSYMLTRASIDDFSFVEELDTSSLKNANGMFAHSMAREIDLSKWNTSNLETAEDMFRVSTWLKVCNLDGWDVSSLKNCKNMFLQCVNLENLCLGWNNLNELESTVGMFWLCNSLQILDITCFDGVRVKDATEMFYDCESLETIYCNGFSVEIGTNAFEYCLKLGNYSEDAHDFEDAIERGYFTAK